MRFFLSRQLLLILIFLSFFFIKTDAQAAINASSCIVGQSCWGSSNFIQYIPGNLPIVLDVPHSGKLKPAEIHDRTQGSVLSGLDTNSREYAYRTVDELIRLTGKRPHLIINHLYRSKYDGNRDFKEGCYPHVSTYDPNNPCHVAFSDFHAAIDDAKNRVISVFGEGHVFDLHTWGGAIGIYLGTDLTVSDLNRSDAALNTSTYQNRSTQKHLSITHNNTLSEITRGARSVGGFLAVKGYPAFPSPLYPVSLPNGGTYPDGAYNVLRHGSKTGGVIDATQIETHTSFIKDQATIDLYGSDLALALLNFVKEKYQFADFNPSLTPSPSVTFGASPSPTPTGTQGSARLKFRVFLPDILSTVTNISAANVQVEVRDGTTMVGSAGVDLIRNGNYFQTATEAIFNIPQSKTYDVFIKTKTSIGRLFTSVTLTQSQTLDCTVTINFSCGELITARDTKSLLSGDSDGFLTSSGSYNRIDSADLQTLASFFNQSATGNAQQADFNLDNSVNIFDLEILGKNYGQRGD